MTRPSGRPPGKTNAPNPVAARTSLAIAVRDRVPAQVLVDFSLAVLMGHDPVLVADDRTVSGWRVDWDKKGEMPPTLDQKQVAQKYLSERGWGMPAQMVQLEADVRQRLEISTAVIQQSVIEAQPLDKLLRLRELFAAPKQLAVTVASAVEDEPVVASEEVP